MQEPWSRSSCCSRSHQGMERRHALASHCLSHPISFQYLPLAKPSWKPVSKGASLMWFLSSVPLQHRAKLGKVGNIFKDKKTKKDMKAHPKSPFSFHYLTRSPQLCKSSSTKRYVRGDRHIWNAMAHCLLWFYDNQFSFRMAQLGHSRYYEF